MIIVQLKPMFNNYYNNLNKIMALLTSDILVPLGQALSLVGLVIVMPFCFAFRTYFRFLDHLQMLFVFAIVLASQATTFSANLSNSWVGFNQNIFFFCTAGQFVCVAGFPLSFGACLLLFLVAMRLIVAIQTCRKKQIRFEPVYTFFKGLTRWIYAPLSYYSVYFLIKSIQGNADSLLSSIVIVAICAIFPVAQLVGYKLIQTEKDDIWRKWLQFLNFYRLFLICGLMAVGSILANLIPYYTIYGVYALYAILFTIKHNFHYKVVGRIVFVLGQALMVAVFSFFLFGQSLLTDYNLDFIAAAVVLVMDLTYYTIQLISVCRNGVQQETDSQKIHPQDTGDRKKKKPNAYEIDLNDVDNEFNNNSKHDIFSKQPNSPDLKGSKSGPKLPKKR